MKTHLRRDAPIHGFVAAYALAALLLAEVADVPHKFAPFTYAGMLAAGLVGPFALIMAAVGLWSLRSPRPIQAMRENLRAMLSGPHTLAGLLLFASMLLFMGVFLSVKTMLTDIVPFHADPLLAEMDRLLHGQDPWRYAVKVLPAPLTPALEAVYFGVWALLLTALMLAVLLVPALKPVRAQYVWTTIVTWVVLGNVLAGAFMSAGPVFYARVTGGDARFDALLSFIAQHSTGHGFGHRLLWRYHLSGEVGIGAAISAFPSMHLAAATLFVLLAARIDRRWMAAAIVYCAVILFGSVYLGWHYAIDGYFSIAAVLVIWKGVGWALARRAP
jgi:hypothetical protein